MRPFYPWTVFAAAGGEGGPYTLQQQQQRSNPPLLQSAWFLNLRSTVLFRHRLRTERYVSAEDRLAAINVCYTRLRSSSLVFYFTGGIESVAIAFDRCLHERLNKLLNRYFRNVAFIEKAITSERAG